MDKGFQFSKKFVFLGGAILLVLILFVLFPSKLPLSSINFDNVMSEKDQKQLHTSASINKPKHSLQNWIDENFTIRKVDNYNWTDDIYVSQNLGKGQYIQTNDGLYYEVAPYDIRFAAYWVTPFPICIFYSDDDEDYPLLITDYYTGTNIHVKETTYDAIMDAMERMEPPKELQPPPQPEHVFPPQPETPLPPLPPQDYPLQQRGAQPRIPPAPSRPQTKPRETQ